MNAPRPTAFRVGEDNVAIGAAWFETAFDCAFGGSTGEVCRRFSDDLIAVLALENADAAYRLSAEEILPLVRAIQWRMSVAAEWAERLDAAESEAAQ